MFQKPSDNQFPDPGSSHLFRPPPPDKPGTRLRVCPECWHCRECGHSLYFVSGAVLLFLSFANNCLTLQWFGENHFTDTKKDLTCWKNYHRLLQVPRDECVQKALCWLEQMNKLFNNKTYEKWRASRRVLGQSIGFSKAILDSKLVLKDEERLLWGRERVSLKCGEGVHRLPQVQSRRKEWMLSLKNQISHSERTSAWQTPICDSWSYETTRLGYSAQLIKRERRCCCTGALQTCVTSPINWL